MHFWQKTVKIRISIRWAPKPLNVIVRHSTRSPFWTKHWEAEGTEQEEPEDASSGVWGMVVKTRLANGPDWEAIIAWLAGSRLAYARVQLLAHGCVGCRCSWSLPASLGGGGLVLLGLVAGDGGPPRSAGKLGVSQPWLFKSWAAAWAVCM